MIKPEDFPYIKSLHVNDCYAYKDFDIILHDYKPFSHLILTGKNGSGKSTILKTINNHILSWRNGKNPVSQVKQMENVIKSRSTTFGKDDSSILDWQKAVSQFDNLALKYVFEPGNLLAHYKSTIIYSFFQAKRESKVLQVQTVTKEEDFTNKLTDDSSEVNFIQNFKQYLVNKKIYQAFDQLNNDIDKINQTEHYFTNLTKAFKAVFEDTQIEIVFIKEKFDIVFKLSDGRTVDFNTLSDGTSAFLSILMDLFMRIDLIRKQIGDFSYDPCGIVLIDEPETHLHLELQYQVLPLLTELFPNIQFIAATHSPAVISSIKKATIFDITTKVTETDDVAGKSYSELMVTHFGLENEYSNIADKIIDQVNFALRDLKGDKVMLRQRLEEILEVNGQYLSPTLRVELESMILQNA